MTRIYTSELLDPEFDDPGEAINARYQARWHDQPFYTCAYWNMQGFAVRFIGSHADGVMQVYCAPSDLETFDHDNR